MTLLRFPVPPTVGEVMSQPVHTVRSDENLNAARTALETLHVHHLLVENKGRIVGIVSDRDVLRNLSPYDLVTVEMDATLEEAAALMLDRGISCLPVRGRQGTVVGVVTKTNLLEATLSCLVSERPAAAA